MAGKLELVLPGLFDLPPAEITPALERDLTALNRILRLASVHSNRAYSIDAMLRRALGFESSVAEGGVSLPLAQAAAEADGRQSERLLLFQAVHLRPDLHDAVIVPIQKNEKNIQDISLIINDLCGLFKVDFDVEVIAEGLFLMELHGFDAPRHYPHLLSVLGKAANRYIEQTGSQLDWYRLLNEMQMFLHQHEINQLRTRQGLLPINSLWFWGGGPPPPVAAAGMACYCDEPLLARFMLKLGVPTANLGEIGVLSADNDAMVIDLRLLESLKTGEDLDIQELLRSLETDLLRPLLRILERDRRRLFLRSGYDCDFELGRFAAFRFWRQPRSLLDWIERDFTD